MESTAAKVFAEGKHEKLCVHPNCECTASVGSKYCSASCEASESRDESGIYCECGHAECEDFFSIPDLPERHDDIRR